MLLENTRTVFLSANPIHHASFTSTDVELVSMWLEEKNAAGPLISLGLLGILKSI
ncbi:MAG: hypothetical protein LLF92_03425 [Planctomycetaceae bacterium]|nr:hypothetical protein [Planctomycetaceae bacterium]